VVVYGGLTKTDPKMAAFKYYASFPKKSRVTREAGEGGGGGGGRATLQFQFPSNLSQIFQAIAHRKLNKNKRWRLTI